MITLYNPDNEVVDHVASYVEGLSRLYVMDNSQVTSETLRESLARWPQVVYIPMGGNKGIAAACNRALDLAAEDGMEWLLTMDQDSSFMQGGFADFTAHLSEAEATYPRLYAYAATNSCDDNISSENGIFSTPVKAITSGMIVNVAMARQAGGFDEDYFIDYVDYEFCYRCVRGGGTLVKYNRLVMNHQVGNSFWRTLRGRHFRVLNEKPFRYYYIMRNYLFVIRDYPEWRRRNIRSMAGIFVKMLLYEPNKWAKLYYTLCGWCGFFRGERGAMPNSVWRG